MDPGVAVVSGAAVFAVKRAREMVPLDEVEAIVVCRVFSYPAVVTFLARATSATGFIIVETSFLIVFHIYDLNKTCIFDKLTTDELSCQMSLFKDARSVS